MRAAVVLRLTSKGGGVCNFFVSSAKLFSSLSEDQIIRISEQWIPSAWHITRDVSCRLFWHSVFGAFCGQETGFEKAVKPLNFNRSCPVLNVNTSNSDLITYPKFPYFMGIRPIFFRCFTSLLIQTFARACFFIILIKSGNSYSWSYSLSVYINCKQAFIWEHVREFPKL